MSKKILFKTEIEGLETIAPVKPSSFYFPKWFKDMPEHLDKDPGEPYDPIHRNLFGKVGDIGKKFYVSTMKRCPAIIDFVSEGFIIPMWADTLIQRDDINLEHDNKNFPARISHHQSEQLTGMPLGEGDFKDALKFESPWFIYTPPGYSTLFIAPFYQYEKRFTILPGLVETDGWHQINFPTIIHEKEFIISQGTPLVQVIPFKRSKLSLVMDLINDKDKRLIQAGNNIISSRFINGYRKAVEKLRNA